MTNELFKVKKRNMEAVGSSQKSISEHVMAADVAYGVYATNLNPTTGLIHCLIATENGRLLSYPCDLLEIAKEVEVKKTPTKKVEQ